MSRIAAYLGVSALAGYAALHVLGRRAGSTATERAAHMPGDELVPAPQMVTDHGVTTDARPEQIWPWLTQMGWHLGGYYTRNGSTGSCVRRTARRLAATLKLCFASPISVRRLA